MRQRVLQRSRLLSFPLSQVTGSVNYYAKERVHQPGFLPSRWRDQHAVLVVARTPPHSSSIANRTEVLLAAHAAPRGGTCPFHLLQDTIHHCAAPAACSSLLSEAESEGRGELYYVGEDSLQRNVFLLSCGGEVREGTGRRSENWVDVRGLLPSLTAVDATVVGLSTSLHQRHQSHKFCSHCGARYRRNEGRNVNEDGLALIVEPNPYSIVCQECCTTQYVNPVSAVIVAVLDGRGRVLLSQQRWKQNVDQRTGRRVLTVLAGFAEPGESLEDAVMREVEEEAGVRVAALSYVGSQPWPFPCQMMACYYAVADPVTVSTLCPEEEEIMSLEWVERGEVQAALKGDGSSAHFSLPPSTAASYQLLSAWAEGLVDDTGCVREVRRGNG